MTKLWITGANGLLGRALVEKANKLCFFATGREVDIGKRDVLNRFVQEHPEITHIVNCAAFSQVDLAETMRQEAYAANVMGSENLASLAKEHGMKLIHISTDYIFPGDLHRSLTENDPVGPCNYYGQTKLEGELKVERILPSACIIRTSGIFGRGGKNFVSKLFQLMQSQKEIRLTFDQWGCFTYAPDLSEAILQMLDVSGVFHFANGGALSKYEFGRLFREEALKMGLPILTESILPVPGSTFPSPCKRPNFSVLNTDKIEKALKITPRTSQTALRSYLENYATHPIPC
ncbi:MAG: dTDP-4-dehydrorhamnose reductase [Chlamydiota bacterium]